MFFLHFYLAKYYFNAGTSVKVSINAPNNVQNPMSKFSMGENIFPSTFEKKKRLVLSRLDYQFRKENSFFHFYASVSKMRSLTILLKRSIPN